MYDFIEKMFNHSKKTYINIKGNICWYSDKKDTISLEKDQVFTLLKYILNESYTTYAGWIFKQIKGVPQGGNASSEIANSTLAMKEYRYLSKNDIKEKGIVMSSRYVDDLCILHNNKFKPETLKSIYGENLQYEQTNHNLKFANFLDLTLEINSHGIISKLYNKTDDYNFKVLRLTHFSSFTPANIKNSLISGEILRIKRASSNSKNFEERITQLKNELSEVKYPEFLFTKILNKVRSKHHF